MFFVLFVIFVRWVLVFFVLFGVFCVFHQIVLIVPFFLVELTFVRSLLSFLVEFFPVPFCCSFFVH